MMPRDPSKWEKYKECKRKQRIGKEWPEYVKEKIRQSALKHPPRRYLNGKTNYVEIIDENGNITKAIQGTL